MKSGSFWIIILGIVNIVIAVGGLYIWRFFLPIDTVLAIISFLLALTTYFGFMAISQSLGKGLESNIGSMRTAIASGVLVLYFFILPVSIFLTFKNALSEFGQSMVNNFTTTIGIIIPFYFGASAYVQAHAPSESKVDEKK
jgi:hypothetical protein